MKKIFITILILVFLSTSLIGCGSKKRIDGVTYDTYGLLSQNEASDEIEYKLIWGNIIWGAILSETIIAPIYFFGFSIFEPAKRLENDPLK